MSTVLDRSGVEAALDEMAAGIAGSLAAGERLALVGIRRGGVPLAEALADRLEERLGRRPDLGAIDITLYRDDLYTGLEKPSFGPTDLPFGLDGCSVVLVDDVLFTGRTVLAALGVLRDFGRPRWVRLAVLVDRGWRELPIEARYVGVTVETARGDTVVVDLEAGVVREEER